MEAAEVTTISLTDMNQLMASFIEWIAPTSVGVCTAKNLTRLGAMGTCMYSSSARVIRTPATSKRFSKAKNIMGRS